MFIICIYGQSGAGKSTLAKRLAKDIGAVYVDVDKYWKNVYYSDFFQKAIVPFFKKEKNLQKPENTIEDGKIKIKDLHVTPRKAYIMRKLLYKYLNYRINRKLRKTNADVIIFDHIKFFEFKAFDKSDFKIYVNTPDDICEQNIMARDYITQERMEHLVENNVVEHSRIYDSIKKDFTISAFSENYELAYKELCLLLNIAIAEKIKKQANISNEIKPTTKQENSTQVSDAKDNLNL